MPTAPRGHNFRDAGHVCERLVQGCCGGWELTDAESGSGTCDLLITTAALSTEPHNYIIFEISQAPQIPAAPLSSATLGKLLIHMCLCHQAV